MKEFLSEKGIEYKELNVAENVTARDEMLKKSGRLAVPTILVDGKAVVGFDRNVLEKLLN